MEAAEHQRASGNGTWQEVFKQPKAEDIFGTQILTEPD